MKKVAQGDNAHIVKMVGCVSQQSPYALLLEYVPYGNLLDYLRENRKLVRLRCKAWDCMIVNIVVCTLHAHTCGIIYTHLWLHALVAPCVHALFLHELNIVQSRDYAIIGAGPETSTHLWRDHH